jgi:hypothetical protein
VDVLLCKKTADQVDILRKEKRSRILSVDFHYSFSFFQIKRRYSKKVYRGLLSTFRYIMRNTKISFSVQEMLIDGGPMMKNCKHLKVVLLRTYNTVCTSFFTSLPEFHLSCVLLRITGETSRSMRSVALSTARDTQ